MSVLTQKYIDGLKKRFPKSWELAEKYTERLKELFPGDFQIVHESLSMLGDDLDGAWASLDDYGIEADIEDLEELSTLRRAWKLSEARPYEVSQNAVD